LEADLSTEKAYLLKITMKLTSVNRRKKLYASFRG
jgi:hypothetical protein